MIRWHQKPGIYDLVASIGSALSVPGFSNRLELPEAKRYVLILVDGLGLELLREHPHLAPFLNGLQNRDGVTSAIPSTTSVNVTSLGTGARPGIHGMAGYSCRIPATTRVLNTLRWDNDIDPLQWQPHDTLFKKIADEGVPTSIVSKGDFEHSGLTQCSQRGVPFVAAESAWERLIALSHLSQLGERSFAFGYESDLDFAGHAFGVNSDEWRETLSRIDSELAELHESLPADTVLVVTADHGMIDIAHEGRFDVSEHEELLENVVVFAGEARFRHLHTTAGKEWSVAERWKEFLGDKVEVRLREETAEWFGPLEPNVAQRFGDVIVAAKNDFGVFHSGFQGIELKMTGFHGSVTNRETSIPVLVSG